MVFKSIFGATCACLIVISFNAQANIIQTGNINEINGVKWLDLSVTSHLTLDEAMNTFDGYRIATKDEFDFMYSYFVDPYDQYFVDTPSESQVVSSGGANVVHENVSGDTYNNSFYDTFGVTNPYRLASWRTNYASLGIYTNNGLLYIGGITRIFDLNHPDSALEVSNYFGENSGFSNYEDIPMSGILNGMGWYMVEENFSVVPVPAAVWLFGSGLLSLIGFARRKKA